MAINVVTNQAAVIHEPSWDVLSGLTSGTIVALFDRPDQLSDALASLANAGIDREAIDVIQAPKSRKLDARSTRLLTRWTTVLQPEREFLRQYLEEVEAGSTLLAIHNLPDDLRNRAASILHTSGGRFINDFGRFTIRLVIP